MIRIAAGVLALVLAAGGARAQDGLGLSPERALDTLKPHYIFGSARIEEEGEGAARKWKIAATEPAGNPDMIVVLQGTRADPGAVMVDIKRQAWDTEADGALGLLLKALLPGLPSPPRALEKSADGKDIDEAFRWPLQLGQELRGLGNFSAVALVPRQIGDRLLIGFGAEAMRGRDLYLIVPRRGREAGDFFGYPRPANPAVQAAIAQTWSLEYDAAAAALTRLAEAGDADATAWLAEAMLLARGFASKMDPAAEEADQKRMSELIERAAQAGSAHGQFWHGMLSRFGHRGRKTEEAADWLRKAAVQGHGPAQFELAMLLLAGQGDVRADAEAGADWLEIAARRGHWFAAIGIAQAYRRGQGRARSAQQAYFWYRVYEARVPLAANVDPLALRRQSTEAGADLEAAERAALDRDAEAWRPLDMAALRQACATIRCPKDLAPGR